MKLAVEIFAVVLVALAGWFFAALLAPALPRHLVALGCVAVYLLVNGVMSPRKPKEQVRGESSDR